MVHYMEHIASQWRQGDPQSAKQCAYLDCVQEFLNASGFFNDIQVTYLMGLSAGSILCHYHAATPPDDVADRLIELHGASVKIIIPN